MATWTWTDPAHEREHRRKRNPCGSNKPTDVTNIAGVYQRVEGTRHNLFRVRINWDRVTQTQAGDDYKPDAYGIQLWGSPDGETWDKDNIRHKQVRGSAGPDGDWGTEDDVKVPNWVVFRNIKPKWYYRVRVRALSKKECDGSLGEWVELGTANDNVAPATPTDVRIYENSTGKRVVIDWEPPLDPDDSEQVDQGVTFFQVQLSKAQNFSTIYRFDRIQASSQKTFTIADADLGDNFYGRVRSIDAAGNKSAWIPARINGNSDPNATAQAAGVGTEGGAAGDTGRQVRVFTKVGLVRKREYDMKWTADRSYRLLRVRAFVGKHDPDLHPEDDGCPRGSSIKLNLRKYDADYDDDTGTVTNLFLSEAKMEIEANKHRDSRWIDAGDSDLRWTTIAVDESISIKVSQVGSEFPGRNLRVNLILEPI